MNFNSNKMKIIKLINIFLFIHCYCFSQNANVELISSSGDSYQNGTLKIEWSLGEVVTELFTCDSLILTQGFQQGVFLHETPDTLILRDSVFLSGRNVCFAAKKTILVAGNNSQFIVNSGATVLLEAGYNIRLMAGTHAKVGSGFHAIINTAGNYCAKKESLLSRNEDTGIGEFTEHIGAFNTDVPGSLANPLNIKVFPNPATNLITIETGHRLENTITVEFFNIVGELQMFEELPGDQAFVLNLSGMPKGFYTIRLSVEGTVWSGKIIKL